MKKRIFYLLLLQLIMVNAMGQIKVKKTYFKSSKQIEFIEYVKSGTVIKLISFYKDGKKKKEKNFDENGKLSGYQVEFSEMGYKIKEMFVIGVESIPYNLIVDTADSENLVEIVNCKEINYHSNGEKESEGFIINGFRTGYWKFYDLMGVLLRTDFYKCLSKD